MSTAPTRRTRTGPERRVRSLWRVALGRRQHDRCLSLSWPEHIPRSGRREASRFKTSLATLDGWQHIILPSVTLALGTLATIIRLTRSGMQENMKQDYVRFAKSKGVPRRTVLFGHALKNTLIPVVTIFGMQMGTLIAFTTITETIFAWPGIGRLEVEALINRDFPIMRGGIIFMALIFLVANLIVDLSYGFIDPRVRYD